MGTDKPWNGDGTEAESGLLEIPMTFVLGTQEEITVTTQAEFRQTLERLVQDGSDLASVRRHNAWVQDWLNQLAWWKVFDKVPKEWAK